MNKGCKKLIDLEKKIGQGSGGVVFLHEIEDGDKLKLDKTWDEINELLDSNLMLLILNSNDGKAEYKSVYRVEDLVHGENPNLSGSIWYAVILLVSDAQLVYSTLESTEYPARYNENYEDPEHGGGTTPSDGK